MTAQRKSFLLVGAAVLGTLLWMAWRQHDAATIEPRNPRQGAVTGGPPNMGPAPKGTTKNMPTLRPFVVSKHDTNDAASFRLGEIGKRRDDEAPEFAKARATAKASWDDFLRDANPTREQQQAILSAIYDGQLYYHELDQLTRGWYSDWAASPGQAGPPPATEWPEDLVDAVRARAREVLNEKQVEIYERYLEPGAVILAVQGDLVQSVN